MSDNSSNVLGFFIATALFVYFCGLTLIHYAGGGLRWWHPLIGIPAALVAPPLLLLGAWLYEMLQTLTVIFFSACGVAFLSGLVGYQLLEHHHDQWLITVGAFDLLWAGFSQIKSRQTKEPLWALNAITTLIAGLLLVTVGIVRVFVLVPPG